MSSRSKTSPKKKVQGGQKGPGKNKKSSQIRGMNLNESPAVAYAKPMKNKGPKIRATEKFVRIIHTEPIGVINQSSGLFSIKQFLAINPGLPTTFKWLSTQAVGWEKYVFEKLEFEYVSRTSTTTDGAILLAIDHDAADAPPVTEDVMSNYNGCVEDSIWVRSLMCKAVCDNTKRFIRQDSLAPNLDVKTYDLGNFISATSGISVQSQANAGKVYASYVVKLFIPQLPSNFNPFVGGTVLSGGTVGQANPFGTAGTVSALTQGIDVVGASRLNFQNIGQYLVTMTGNGAGLTALNAPTIFSGSGSVTDSGSVPNAAGTVSFLKSVINTTVPNTVVDWTFTGNPGFASSHTDIARSPIGSII